MKTANVSSSDFEQIRHNDNIYIDKTSYIHGMITSRKSKHFFCARPRRFGKSLTISTLVNIFLGKRELFDGLYIKEETDYNWERYPIIHLQLDECQSARTAKELNWYLTRILIETPVGKNISNPVVQPAREIPPSLALTMLIKKLKEKYQKNVVLLIDEYDSVLTNNLREKTFPELQAALEDFYGSIKENEENLRFLFITGILNLPKASILRSLNNLYDISTAKEYSEMYGYTQQELENHFRQNVSDAVAVMRKSHRKYYEEMTGPQLLKELEARYGGYKFHPDGAHVYNPYAINSFFSKGYDLNYYWSQTGSLITLLKYLQISPDQLADTENFYASETELTQFDIKKLYTAQLSHTDLLAFLFQTGYLTIESYDTNKDADSRFLKLRYPNQDVCSSIRL